MAKYSKFLLSIILILSLVAPTYASLSAADGSAFVTKAEFDSALADFNARLTTFEAGINSKIDSQVTSYLDRNGIWNGQSQTIKNSNIKSTLVKSSGKHIGAMEVMKLNGTWAYSASNDMVYRFTPMEPTDVCLCEKTTKAGLCYLKYSQSAVELGWMWVSWDGNNTNNDQNYFSYSFVADIYEGTATTSSAPATIGSELVNSIVEAGSTAIPARFKLVKKDDQHILFFTKKNISLWARMSNSCSGKAGATIPETVYNGGPTWTIKSIDIY